MNEPFLCLDCGVDTNAINEYYMVHYNVWAQTGLVGQRGMLCIGCLENRIGRTLALQDFTEHMCQHRLPANVRLSDRLKNRLGVT